MANDITENKRRLQAEMKQLLGSAETIRQNAEKSGKWDDASVKSYEELLGKTDAIKMSLSLIGREEELRDWAHSSAGAAVVNTYGAGDSARMAGPDEGTFGEAVVRLDRKSGELYGEGAAGERKVEVLKSGAYKDAVNRYLRSNALARYGTADRWALKGDAMKVVSEGSDTAGGLWVVPEFNATLIKKLPTMANVVPAATHITVGSDRVSFPKVKYTTDDKYTSGVRYSWTGEAPSADISEATDPSAARTEINIYVATAAIILTRANMEDAQFDLLGLISNLLSEAYILGDEDTAINSNGVGKPNGFLNHSNATVASGSGGMYVASGLASAMDWGLGTNIGKGILGVDAALPPQYEPSAFWLGNKATYNQVRGLVDGDGRPLWSAGDSYPNFANGQQTSLLGYPTKKSQFMPDVSANTYPLALGDFSGYWIADRVGITVEVLRELRALRDEVVVYARKRWGGQLVHDWRVKLQKIAAS